MSIVEFEPDPIAIDPRPCAICGCTIDLHFRVDTFDGPEFFCQDLEVLIHLRAADLVRQWELADPRDVWRHMGDAPPPASVRNSTIGEKPAKAQRPYRTPQSTVDAFWHVVREGNTEKLESWLANHPSD